MKTSGVAQAKIWVSLLITLCSLSLPLARAQNNRTSDIPPGFTLIDGDILMPTWQYNSLLQSRRQKPNAPAATLDPNLWSGGVVPFEFDANVTPSRQTIMINAMAVLENVANVDFQQCAGNACSGNYVHVQHSTENNSAVGMQGGQQVINIVSWESQFTIVHELLHCLGFYHEQSRPDRDTYVQINCNNVQGGCSGAYISQFRIENHATAYGYYDFDSVMHYGQCYFSINSFCHTASATYPDGGITIRVNAPYNTQWQSGIGQRNHLSELDKASLSYLYPFANWRFVDCNYNGSNGPSNGTFLQPYTSFAEAFDNTPAGGTLWILRTCNFPAVGTYNKQVTVKAAPGVLGTLGS